jgi:hypothetical protein
MRLVDTLLLLGAVVSGLLFWNRPTLPAGAVSGGLVFIGIAATNLVVSAMGDVLDQVRHQLIFFAQLDVLMLAALWLGVRLWNSRLASGSTPAELPITNIMSTFWKA